jgi:hypothetical protein
LAPILTGTDKLTFHDAEIAVAAVDNAGQWVTREYNRLRKCFPKLRSRDRGEGKGVIRDILRKWSRSTLAATAHGPDQRRAQRSQKSNNHFRVFSFPLFFFRFYLPLKLLFFELSKIAFRETHTLCITYHTNRFSELTLKIFIGFDSTIIIGKKKL